MTKQQWLIELAAAWNQVARQTDCSPVWPVWWMAVQRTNLAEYVEVGHWALPGLENRRKRMQTKLEDRQREQTESADAGPVGGLGTAGVVEQLRDAGNPMRKHHR